MSKKSKSIDDMTKSELMDYARKNNIKYKQAWKKAKIKQAIIGKRGSKKQNKAKSKKKGSGGKKSRRKSKSRKKGAYRRKRQRDRENYICMSEKHGVVGHYFSTVRDEPDCPKCKGLFDICVFNYGGKMPDKDQIKERKKEYRKLIEK